MTDKNEFLNQLSEEQSIAEPATINLSDIEIEKEYESLPFRVVYQNNNYFLPQIFELIDKREVINLRPEYQRRLRWNNKEKSLLIESLLLNIPIPPIFLYENDLARYEVMDGQQRLNAIYEFLRNDFALTGLEKVHFLNGKRFNKLPPKLSRALDRASLSAIVLLRETRGDTLDPYLVRRYVFERLNTGGRALNAQEMRNSIYRGAFNDLIVKLTKDSSFCKIFEIPAYSEVDENEYYENPDRQKNALYRTMGDCQIILRFFALMEEPNISGSMRSILDNCMKRELALKIGDARLDEFEHTFRKLIEASLNIFEGDTFRLPPDRWQVKRLSIGLYDAILGGLYRRYNRLDDVLKNKAAFKEGVYKLLEQNDSLELLTGRANTAQAIKDRIGLIVTLIDNVVA